MLAARKMAALFDIWAEIDTNPYFLDNFHYFTGSDRVLNIGSNSI